MRLLQLHCDFFEYRAEKKAVKQGFDELSPEALKQKHRFENVLVLFTSVEKGDSEETAKKAALEVKKNFHEVQAATVLVYPYAHLSSNLAKPSEAARVLSAFLHEVRAFAPHAEKSPFGWYKSFELKCKGHPLAELSKTISLEKDKESGRGEEDKPGGSLGETRAAPEKEVVSQSLKKEELSASLQQESKLQSEFFIFSPDGSLVPVSNFDYGNQVMLKALVDYELKKIRTYAEEPPHIKLMRQHHLVVHESASDSGNMRWMPKGLLIKRLLEKAVTDLCVGYGALQVETPIMYDYEHPALRSYLNRFPARQYTVKSDEKEFFLRFAACFGGLLFAHDLTISYKNLPLPIYEITHYSFRREQSGELVGLKRLRAFTMPDMHTLCVDFQQAKTEFEKQYALCLDWNTDLGIDFEIAFRAQKEFFHENKEWYLRMVQKMGRPILVELFDLRYAYFITKFEFNYVDTALKASGLSTVQIDVENGERFDIKYTDVDGKKNHPLVLHASIPGAIDRVLYALLEREAGKTRQGKTALFPLWLSPTQVRLIPVSNKQNEFCEALLGELRTHRVRADFDDRAETLNSKIRGAEQEWVPYIVVVGEIEVASKQLAIRRRIDGKQQHMTLQQLVGQIEKETAGKPFERLSLSDHLSRRPVF